MGKSLTYTYLIFFLAAVVVLICSFFLTKEERYSIAQDNTAQEAKIIETRQISESEREFLVDVNGMNEENNCLLFMSVHQNITIEADGKIIYKIDKGNKRWTQTTGSIWNFVSLPYTADRVKINVEAIYPAVDQLDMTYYIGDGPTMAITLIRSSMWEVVICFLDIAIGLFLAGYWLVYRKRTGVQKDVFYLGIFAITVGVWSVSETNFYVVLSRNHSTSSAAGFISLMLFIVPFVLFVRESFGLRGKKFVTVICILSFINEAVVIALHITRVSSFKQMVTSTHLLMVASMFYFLYGIIYGLVQKQKNRKVKANILASAILLISAMTDFYLYYINAMQSFFAGRVGLLLYIGIISVAIIGETYTQIDEGRRAVIYKELAITDLLTQLYNRNAYIEWENANARTERVMLINFDLNDLKYHNDTMGHAAGDKYIIDAALIIKEAFARIGKAYRIGGDEFCVVIENVQEDAAIRCLENLEERQDEYNKISVDIRMQIAYGYAVFDPDQDANMEATRGRADMMMYARKVIIKNDNIEAGA